ncbi:hypothetical protein NI17_020405 [Thermobifida halotolerans]|uniref:Uncharacterized protein n=1 Tax=Thermobifida halotolerans TaxID=483545 RepID=A0A399G3D3_9ACTN|nr:hypothetical protein [Thermobifida halotolerans]UOE19090.1 hypothetical protein NI17_020405 [Thermobifida halotolerans]
MTVHVVSVGLSLVEFFEDPESERVPEPVPGAEAVGEEWRGGRLGLGDHEPVGRRLDAAFGTGAADDSPERQEFQELAGRVGAQKWIRYRGVSAELDTVRAVVGGALPADDAVFLIASDTDDGVAAAVWTAIALADGDTRRVRYLPAVDEDTRLGDSVAGRVHVVRMPGLDAADSDRAFREPMRTMGRLGRLLTAPPESALGRLKRLVGQREEICFHLSGGYKATLPYLVALAEWLRSLGEEASAWVLHETSERAFRMPLRRLHADWVRRELQGFHGGKRAKAPETDFLEGYAYEREGDGGARLTAFGEGMRELFGIPTEPVPQ